MGDREHTKQPVEEERPVPDEADREPEEQLSRPEQDDFDPAERDQYQRPIAEQDRPEDR
jgi:hypothetical protein